MLSVILEHEAYETTSSRLTDVSSSLKDELTAEKLKGVKIWITAGPREKFTASEVISQLKYQSIHLSIHFGCLHPPELRISKWNCHRVTFWTSVHFISTTACTHIHRSDRKAQRARLHWLAAPQFASVQLGLHWVGCHETVGRVKTVKGYSIMINLLFSLLMLFCRLGLASV